MTSLYDILNWISLVNRVKFKMYFQLGWFDQNVEEVAINLRLKTRRFLFQTVFAHEILNAVHLKFSYRLNVNVLTFTFRKTQIFFVFISNLYSTSLVCCLPRTSLNLGFFL